MFGKIKKKKKTYLWTLARVRQRQRRRYWITTACVYECIIIFMYSHFVVLPSCDMRTQYVYYHKILLLLKLYYIGRVVWNVHVIIGILVCRLDYNISYKVQVHNTTLNRFLYQSVELFNNNNCYNIYCTAAIVIIILTKITNEFTPDNYVLIFYRCYNS